MMFSVIIPTRNRNELLALCLDKLSPGIQSLPAGAYEVIVTDDSDEFVAKDFVQKTYPWVRYTKGPRQGPAANRNNGATKANAAWLVFLDDDCLPDQDLLDNYRKMILENSSSSAFEGAIRPERERLSALEHAPLNVDGALFWSCNCCVERRLFQNINGFDPNFRFPHMEDIDLKERLLLNTDIIFAPQAFVIHPWRKLASGKKLGYYHESDIYFFQLKKGQKVYWSKMVKNIIGHRLILLKKYFSLQAGCIIFYHLFLELCVVSLNYNKWISQYPVSKKI